MLYYCVKCKKIPYLPDRVDCQDMSKSWYCSKMVVAYAADEPFPEDQWCIPEDVG